MNKNFQLIETEQALTDICEQFRASAWLAVDTEFEREKTFYPELCLVQIANADIVAVIDPLLIENLEPLFKLLYDDAIVKVFHAARQDLEIFFNIKGAIPQPLFDTQIAAPLMGYNEQMGYANLVSRMLGVELSKAHTRTDWKRRPLQAAQLEYAADDVIYLGEVYCILRKQLEEKDRLGWLENDFLALTESKLYEPDIHSVWKKNRGAKKLKGKKLCALQHMAAWREQKARAENRPRNWLMRDESLLDVAQLQPQSIADLERLKSLNAGQIKKYGAEILQVLAAAEQHSAPLAEQKKDRKPLNIQEEAKIDAMSAMIRLIANANNLHPNILASQKELEKLLRGDTSSLLLQGWRARLAGRQLEDFLHGKISLQVVENELLYRQQ